MSKPAVLNFLESLIAVLMGNVLYFLLMPRLPQWARHVTLRIDLGMVVDLCFCLVVLGLIKSMAGQWNRSSKP